MSTVVRPPSRATRRRDALKKVHILRTTSQLAFVALVLVVAIRHQTEKGSSAPSVDALCPFGGIETAWTFLTTGTLVEKTQISSLILGIAVLVGILIAGNAFCGWVCPFGAVQDLVSWVRRRLHLSTVTVPARVDRSLRWGRFVVLGVIVLATAQTASLVFWNWDPYVTLFSLHWWFEWSDGLWIGLTVLGVVLAGSLAVDRFWCRYLCPAGAVFSVLGRFSFLKIRRRPSACTGCDLCSVPCPVGIDVAHVKDNVGPDCIGCLDCVANCTFGGALEVAGPTWLGSSISTKRPS